MLQYRSSKWWEFYICTKSEIMSLKDTINSDIKAAMLAKEKEKLSALRAIKSAILLAETDKGGADGLSEEKELELLQKLMKQRVDSSEMYKSQGREDLAVEEDQQAEVIKAYLPEQMSEDEVRAEVVAAIQSSGASSPADMGKVMGPLMGKLKGKADGKMISRLVKEELNK